MPVDKDVELKKIELERTKAQWEFWRTVIVGGVAVVLVAAVTALGTVYVGYLNNRSAKEIELIKIDSGLVTAFSAQFLAEDIGTRIRAAHLFKSIAPSDDIRARWTAYHKELADFNEAIIQAGKDPNEDISDLLKDPKFLKDWGGLGCSGDNLTGCVAVQPKQPDGLVNG